MLMQVIRLIFLRNNVIQI